MDINIKKFQHTNYNFGKSFVYSGFIVSSAKKEERVLWQDIFKTETDRYSLIGSGCYKNIFGEVAGRYKGKGLIGKKDDKFNLHFLEGVILISNISDKKVIYAGEFFTWDQGKHKEAENPFYNYLFELERGRIAKSNKEKNQCIENIIGGI